MPKYRYFCSSCERDFGLFHHVDQKETDCPHCSAQSSLTRIPNMAPPGFGKNLKLPAGTVVKNTIEEIKKELLEEKNNREDYEV